MNASIQDSTELRRLMHDFHFIFSLKSLIATLGMSIEEAMNALRIPDNGRGTYTDLLAKQ